MKRSASKNLHPTEILTLHSVKGQNDRSVHERNNVIARSASDEAILVRRRKI